jgi:hypothetical protein
MLRAEHFYTNDSLFVLNKVFNYFVKTSSRLFQQTSFRDSWAILQPQGYRLHGLQPQHVYCYLGFVILPWLCYFTLVNNFLFELLVFVKVIIILIFVSVDIVSVGVTISVTFAVTLSVTYSAMTVPAISSGF